MFYYIFIQVDLHSSVQSCLKINKIYLQNSSLHYAYTIQTMLDWWTSSESTKAEFEKKATIHVTPTFTPKHRQTHTPNFHTVTPLSH